ncbi:hypothetical protein C2I18_14205 [Paenibacillus sp. PK3_47]|uniref:hypothetical protein n=1 Tax=Paenibacillus sp. PK3_47 TaxID=2072642 RepID=UPI00201E0C0F|nr:hypothetical protein [Paenibacillus sp. PK3_47]UQZ34571.1 hypothetical protein C2I18_14205 [Paenibacillus sp. PK3_47]
MSNTTATNNGPEIHSQTGEITDFMLDKMKAATDQGEEAVLHFLAASAYVAGFCIALAASNPEAVGPLMTRSIDALTSGIQSGLQFTAMPIEFVKIVHE